MARSPKLTTVKKTALTLLLARIMASYILKIQPIKAVPKTITFGINIIMQLRE